MISEGMLDILDKTAPYDIMIISEARQQHDVVGWAIQKYGQDRFLCSLPHEVNPKTNRKKDQQGQVAIFQRYRAAVAMTDSGSDCRRTIWASYNIDTGSAPVFVYGAYIPVKSRGEASHPNQADTWAVLQERMALAPNRAARFLLMDANAEPARGIAGVTGKYSVRPRHSRPMDEAGIRLVENMRKAKMALLSTMEIARPSKSGGTASWAPKGNPSRRFQLDYVAGNQVAADMATDVTLDWLTTRLLLGDSIDHACIVVTVRARLTKWAKFEQNRPFGRMAAAIEEEAKCGKTVLRDAWRMWALSETAAVASLAKSTRILHR